jgi:UDP-glucose 4-epimerase
MNMLIVGGAGYIGGVTAHLAHKDGHQVTIVDNLSSGREYNVPKGATLITADVRDRAAVAQVFTKDYDAIMYFAAKILVPESMQKPFEYFDVNTVGALNVIDHAAQKGIPFIFSSTAAVYGAPERIPLEETDQTRPVNPYGASKLMTEQLLQSYHITHKLNWVAMRYFNVAGAFDGVGTDYPFVSHIVPMLLDKMDRHEPITINGKDYQTPDGTAIRDYVHVRDLAQAHLVAAKKMMDGLQINQPINVGSQNGYSVKEVADTFNEVTGAAMPIVYGERRAGDPPKLVASNKRAKDILGWQPERDLKTIIKDHYGWYATKRPA